MPGQEKNTPPPAQNNPVHHRSLREQKQNRLILFGFLATAAVIIGLVGYGVYYEKFGKYREPVATIEGQQIDSTYFIERVRLERNGYIQQMGVITAQSQLYASDPNFQDYFKNQLTSIQSYLDDSQGFAGDVLERMIEEQIAVVEAEKRGISLDEDTIEKAVQELMFRYYPNGTPTPTSVPTMMPSPTYSPTQVALLSLTQTSSDSSSITEQTPEPGATPTVSGESYLPTATPYTFDMYKTAYTEYIEELAKMQVSEESLRKYIKNYLLNQKVFEAVTEETPKSEERVWARHILVKTEGEAMIVLNRLASDEDWSKIASDVSIDTSNKDTGGDLGWFGKGMMVAEFEKAAFELGIGEVSKPVQTSFGWHIIQVIGHDTLPLDDAEFASAKEEFYSKWLEEAKTIFKIVKGNNWEELAPSDPAIPAEFRVQ